MNHTYRTKNKTIYELSPKGDVSKSYKRETLTEEELWDGNLRTVEPEGVESRDRDWVNRWLRWTQGERNGTIYFGVEIQKDCVTSENLGGVDRVENYNFLGWLEKRKA